jgi:predicted unusual protein kinase regulating ubiquinone biosynthesis (AarF/ABC1/UbiB family)
MVSGSGKGLERVVDQLGELRGLGTKVGQMAGLLEANLPAEVRDEVGPALAKLRAQAARSPYAGIAKLVEEDLGAPPEELFARFDEVPFASASLGQVHDAEHHDGRHLAVKVQHPGIREAFSHDLENVTSLGRVATSFFMPRGQSKGFIGKIREGFLAELDYVREADNLATFAALLEGDADLELPLFVPELSSARVLTTTFLEGETVEIGHGYPVETRRRQAAAIRRLVISALTDHGLLYADAHAGNFFFRENGTVGVLDFGSVFRFEDPQRDAFAEMRDAATARDRSRFGVAVNEALGVGNPVAAEAIANVQWIAIGGLVRGEAIDGDRVRALTREIMKMKKVIVGQRFQLPFFMPFLMRTMVACNALLAGLDAPESGPVGRVGDGGARRRSDPPRAEAQ